MNQRAKDRESVVALVQEAFRGVSRANGVSLHEAAVIDNHGSDAARRRARLRDIESRWEDVPGDDIRDHYSALSFLDPIGFRYYIAPYMVWALRNFDRSDSLSVDHTIYSLNPSLKPKIRAWQLERFALFSEQQASAVASFLRFMLERTNGRADDGAAGEALFDYWEKYEKADS
jgi:hypothetical protein